MNNRLLILALIFLISIILAPSAGATSIDSKEKIDSSLYPFMYKKEPKILQEERIEYTTSVNRLSEIYGRDNFSRIDIAVELKVNVTSKIRDKNFSSYRNASTYVSSLPEIQTIENHLSDVSGIAKKDLTYIMYSNSIIINNIDPSKLPEIASLPEVKKVKNGMIPLESKDYSGPENYGSGKNGVKSKKLTNNSILNGEGVKVGVIDTGANHTDLKEDITELQNISDGINDNDDPDMLDRGDHGTHVAGIVNQVAPNSSLYVASVNGIGPNRIFLDYNEYALALEWLLDQNVDVISQSQGTVWLSGTNMDGSSQVAKLADRAVSGYYGEQNSLGGWDWTQTSARPVYVVSAGNEESRHDGGSLDNSQQVNLHNNLYLSGVGPVFLVLYWDSNKGSADFNITAPDGTIISSSGTGRLGIPIPISSKWDARAIYINNPDQYVGAGDWEIRVKDGPVDYYHLEVRDSRDSRTRFSLGYFQNNDGRYTITAPATAKKVISVGAVDQHYGPADIGLTRDGFSSKGPLADGRIKPDVVAPGEDIWSTVPGGNESMSGTSQAAPHVAGSAALLIQQYKELHGEDPAPAEIKTLLMGSAVNQTGDVKTTKDNTYGAGIVDVYRAYNSFIFSGVNSGEEDSVSVWTPDVFNSSYLPAKGTLYWEDWNDDFNFSINQDSGSKYDTTMMADKPASSGTTYNFRFNGTFSGWDTWLIDPDDGEEWFLSTTYPPIGQDVDGEWVDGYSQNQYSLSRDGDEAVFAVPVGVDHGGTHYEDKGSIRVMGYLNDSNEAINLTLQDPSKNTVFESNLTDVSAVQVFSGSNPSHGGWKVEAVSQSGEQNLSLMSEYPLSPLPTDLVYKREQLFAGSNSNSSIRFSVWAGSGGNPFVYYPFNPPNSDNFNVKIGGKEAQVQTVDSKRSPGCYELTVMPPTQPREGSYDLSVNFSFEKFGVSNTATLVKRDAVQYGSGEEVNIDTALVIDSSGSMYSNDPNDLRKDAAKYFVDQLTAGDRAAVVDFDSDVTVRQRMVKILAQGGSNVTKLKDAIDQIDSSGSTNIGGGLLAGYNELDTAQILNRTKASHNISSPHPYPNDYNNTWTINRAGARYMRLHFTNLSTESGYDYVYILDGNGTRVAAYDGTHNDQWTPWVEGGTIKVQLTSDSSVTEYGFDVDMYEYGSYGGNRKAVILLTDGYHNTGTDPSDVVPRYKAKDWPVYTIALTGDADENLLKNIAQETGGIYKKADSADDLLEIYRDLKQTMKKQNTVESTSGSISQNQSKEDTVNIDDSVQSFDVSLSWGGSDLNLTLYYPNGSRVEVNASTATGTNNPNITYTSASTYEVYKVSNPDRGNWTYNVTAVQVTGEENYTATVAASTTTSLSASTDKATYYRNGSVSISASFVNATGGVPNADVTANITRPGGTIDILNLSEKTTGVYEATYLNTSSPGTYRVAVRAEKGGITRMDTVSFDVRAAAPSINVTPATISRTTHPGDIEKARITITNPGTSGQVQNTAFKSLVREMKQSGELKVGKQSIKSENLKSLQTAQQTGQATAVISARNMVGRNSTISSSRVSISSPTVTIPSNGTATITLTLNLPYDTPLGNYSGSVRVISNHGNVRIPVKISVKQLTQEAAADQIQGDIEKWHRVSTRAAKSYYSERIADRLVRWYYASPAVNRESPELTFQTPTPPNGTISPNKSAPVKVRSNEPLVNATLEAQFWYDGQWGLDNQTGFHPGKTAEEPMQRVNGTTWRFNITHLHDLKFRYRVTGKDMTGNTNTTETRYLTIAGHDPMIEVHAPSHVYQNTSGKIYYIVWEGSPDTLSLSRSFTPSSGPGGGGFGSFTPSSGPGGGGFGGSTSPYPVFQTLNFTLNTSEPGTWNYTIYANDTFGNQNSTNKALRVLPITGGLNLTGNAQILWQHPEPRIYWATPESDFNGDNTRDIVTYSYTSPDRKNLDLSVVSGNNGTRIWRSGLGRSDWAWSDDVGDLDGDGQEDLVVEKYWYNRTTYSEITALKGDTGDILWSKHVEEGDIYRTDIDIGDVSGDSRDELLLDYHNYNWTRNTETSEVSVVRGMDGSQIWNRTYHSNETYADADIQRYGDLSGDGKRDVVITYIMENNSGANTAYRSGVEIVSGADGTTVWRMKNVSNNYPVRYNAEPVEDIDSDGYPDIVISMTGPNEKTMAVKGNNGQEIWSVQNTQLETLGQDLDGDGIAEVLVKDREYYWRQQTVEVGMLSGGNGSRLWNTTLQFGNVNNLHLNVDELPDLTGDGKLDLVVEAEDSYYNSSIGTLYTNLTFVGLKGSDGKKLWRKRYRNLREGWGHTRGWTGDLTGDGKQDLALRIEYQTSNNVYNRNTTALKGYDGSKLWSIKGTGGDTRVSFISRFDSDAKHDVLVTESISSTQSLSSVQTTQKQREKELRRRLQEEWEERETRVKPGTQETTHLTQKHLSTTGTSYRATVFTGDNPKDTIWQATSKSHIGQMDWETDLTGDGLSEAGLILNESLYMITKTGRTSTTNTVSHSTLEALR